MAEPPAPREELEKAASMNDIIDLNVGGTRLCSVSKAPVRLHLPLYTVGSAVQTGVQCSAQLECCRFQTTRQSLLHDPNSMLARMFDPISPLSPGVFMGQAGHMTGAGSVSVRSLGIG